MQKAYKILFLSALVVTQISAQDPDEKLPSALCDNQDALYNLALEIASLKDNQDKTTQALEELRLKLETIERPPQSPENISHDIRQKSPLEEELELVQRLVHTQAIKYQDYLLAQNEAKVERDRIIRENDKLAQKLVETTHLKEALENEKKILEIALAYQKGPPEILIQKIQEVILACDELTTKIKNTLHTLESENSELPEVQQISEACSDDESSIQQSKYDISPFSISLIDHHPLQETQWQQTLLKNEWK